MYSEYRISIKPLHKKRRNSEKRNALLGQPLSTLAITSTKIKHSALDSVPVCSLPVLEQAEEI
jgi:hypothetical protein